MSELDALRGSIDEIDAQIVHLFQRRMAVTEKVGRYKAEHGIPVLDMERENEVLEKKTEGIEDPAMRTDITLLYETIMGISRRQQRAIVPEGEDSRGFALWQSAVENRRAPVLHPRVVYQGEAGAYSEMAAVSVFGDDMECSGLPQFEDVFEAVRQGEADYGVVPIENSTTGAIRQIFDLLARYEYYIVAETTVRVAHCLMAPKGATLDTVRYVYSHEQGLFQSEQFLNRHPDWKRIPAEDTAGSARYVAQENDIHKAAIGSKRAAELYGLEILAENVNYNAHNTTRFVVISPRMERREGSNKVSTVFTTPHRPAALHRVLTVFAVNSLNVVRLESRPMPGKNWEYMFFLEFTGDLEQSGMEGILHELSQVTEDFRILGNFPENLGEGDLS